MRSVISESWARGLGALVGAGLAIVVLAGASVAPGSGRLGLDLTVAITPTGEVAVSPPGPLVSRAGMEPGGDAARGTVKLQNQTGRRLPFDLRALPSTADGDAIVLVRLESDGHLLYDGPLGGLRRAGAARLVLGPGETRPLTLVARVDPDAGERHAGRIVDVLFEVRAEARS